jgi:hypothetical protein
MKHNTSWKAKALKAGQEIPPLLIEPEGSLLRMLESVIGQYPEAD